MRDGVPTTEFDVQRLMNEWFAEAGLMTDSGPNVSAQENAGNPHYLPNAEVNRAIGPDELVLLDLWGKLDIPGAVFADITWVGLHGPARAGGNGQGVCGDSRRPRRGRQRR